MIRIARFLARVWTSLMQGALYAGIAEAGARPDAVGAAIDQPIQGDK